VTETVFLSTLKSTESPFPQGRQIWSSLHFTPLRIPPDSWFSLEKYHDEFGHGEGVKVAWFGGDGRCTMHTISD